MTEGQVVIYMLGSWQHTKSFRTAQPLSIRVEHVPQAEGPASWHVPFLLANRRRTGHSVDLQHAQSVDPFLAALGQMLALDLDDPMQSQLPSRGVWSEDKPQGKRMSLPCSAPNHALHLTYLAEWAGVWFLNACRIVYLLDETSPVRRYGFAYGTLPGHAERGEERCSVEWHSDDTVWYDLLAFSRPSHWLLWLGYPWVRRLQRRFGLASLASMVQAVGAPAAFLSG